MAFVNGKPDPWGMKVNPSYQGSSSRLAVAAPRHLHPDEPGGVLPGQNPVPYLPEVAAPVTALRQIANAVLDAWPNVRPSASALGRRTRRSSAASTGRAWRSGSCSASPPSATPRGSGCARRRCRPPGHFVGPTRRGLAAARALGQAGGRRSNAFDLDQTEVRTSTTAYPGTMIVYTAAQDAMDSSRPKRGRSPRSSTSPRPRARKQGAATAGCRRATCRSDGRGDRAAVPTAQRVAVAIKAQKGAPPRPIAEAPAKGVAAASATAPAPAYPGGSAPASATGPHRRPVTPVADRARPARSRSGDQTAPISSRVAGCCPCSCCAWSSRARRLLGFCAQPSDAR